MKQTAVDYLFKQLWDRPKDKMVWFYIFEKAKQMEKQQIIDAHGNQQKREPTKENYDSS